MKITIPSHLSDTALAAELTSLAGRERGAAAQLIAHLAEFDARRLYLGAGFPSLFAYCVKVLRLSEAAAYNRIEAARAARRFPVVLDRLAEGSLNMTTVRLLAAHLTTDNHLELLGAASGKSRRAVEELLARYFPRPDVAFLVRKLPAPRLMPAPPIAAGSTPTASMTPAGAPLTAPGPLLPALPAPATRRAVVAPLAPDRYEIRFTADAETCEMLQLAQDMLRHAVPTGDPAETVKRALRVLLEDLARKKFAATDRPRASRGAAPGSRYVSAKIRRAVWIRDYGRCAYSAERASLQLARLCRVPSLGSVWGGRRGDRRDDGASLSRPQQLRGRALLRPPSAHSFWNECTTAADGGERTPVSTRQ